MGIYILCPYFKRERKRSITCEDTIRLYPTVADKRRVLKEYCTTEWKRCPVASALERIYAEDIPDELIKEKIMENTLESMKKEINALMRENGQLMKKLENLREEINKRDSIARANHDMYRESLDKKEKLLKAKDEQVRWLESFASAFLVVAYGKDAREVRMPKSDVLKLMTSYTLQYRLDPEEDTWVFEIGTAEEETDE